MTTFSFSEWECCQNLLSHCPDKPVASFPGKTREQILMGDLPSLLFPLWVVYSFKDVPILLIAHGCLGKKRGSHSKIPQIVVICQWSPTFPAQRTGGSGAEREGWAEEMVSLRHL